MKKTALKVIRDKNIDVSILKKLKIGIIGYGSQGRAQALNIRDSGFMPAIGLPSKSKTRNIARKDGFAVVAPAELASEADLIAVLAPDHKHRELFEKDIFKVSQGGQTFVFAHALSVHFRLVTQPPRTDFVLVAPHGPGQRLREKYLHGEGIPAFIAKTGDSSKKSLKLAKAYAKAIGCARSGLIKTTFEHEAIGDIFGEQAILCGGLSGLLKAGFDTLVKAGLPPTNAYIECIYQIDLIIDLIKKYGIDGMYDRISTTAAYGGLLAEEKIINPASKKAMQKMLQEIKNGKFVKDLMADYDKSFKKLNRNRLKKRPELLDKTALLFDRKFGN
jgi:ketol-acid reductoisomerase